MKREFFLYMLDGFAIGTMGAAFVVISSGGLAASTYLLVLLCCWIVLWSLFYPFLLLIYFTIDTILVLIGHPVDKVKLR